MKELFANADAGMAGLIFFLVLFLGVVAWLFRPGAKTTYKQHSEIPLREDKDK